MKKKSFVSIGKGTDFAGVSEPVQKIIKEVVSCQNQETQQGQDRWGDQRHDYWNDQPRHDHWRDGG